MIFAVPREPGRWRNRTTFVLALSAAAIGLGNFWRFSYLSGEYGGAPFLIAYVVCLFGIAVPAMVAEVVLGSAGGPSPVTAIRRAADRSLRSRGWMLVGGLACFTGLLLLSIYVVVAGWSIAYAGFMDAGVFTAARAAEVGEYFERFLSDPVRQIYWQSLFLLCVFGIVVLGVKRGLGLLVWLVVPAMFALLAFLIKFGFDNGDIEATHDFLFTVRWVDFTPQSVLVALGHAFFSLGVGVGTGISYGAYAPQRIPVGRSVLAVAVVDTMVALLAGLAVFPVVFANNVAPSDGPGLLFISLPYAFGNLMQGDLSGTLFFVLVVLAALGSAVAIMEPMVAALTRTSRLGRFTAALVVAVLVWIVSVAVVTSSVASAWQPWFGYQGLFALLDVLTGQVLLPLVALLIAVLVGWRLHPEIVRQSLDRESRLFFSLWRFVLRYIVPPAILLMLLFPLLQAWK